MAPRLVDYSIRFTGLEKVPHMKVQTAAPLPPALSLVMPMGMFQPAVTRAASGIR